MLTLFPGTYRTYHIKRALHAHLHRKGIMTFVAPYSAAAQMAYLERANFVHGCVGSASCLVFGCAKVITRFDWDRLSVPGDKPCCIYVSTEQCMQKLNLTREQFMELCLVSGSSSIIPALPEVEELPMPNMTAARSLLTRCNNDVAALCYSKSEDQYLLQLHKARYAVKFPVISTQEAGVEIYDWKNAPSDSHDFIGQRLPDEVYDYLQRGVIGPRALDWRARHEVLETQPLDGGHSSAYRDLVQKKLAPMRAQTLGLMTHLLNRYYQKKDVELLCWFKETEKKALSIPDHTDAYKPTDSWHVQQSAMPTESTNPDVSPLLYAIRALADDAAAEKTITPRPAGAGHQVREPSEVRANTVWRFLQDRGYLTPEHTLSTWGKALKVAFDQAASNGIMTSDDRRKEIEEAIFIAFELLRLDVLNAENMFPAPPYSGAPMRGSETDKAHTLLISRVACLASFQHDQIGYTGPLSRHTLAYHQMTAAVRGALRDLVEMHATNMFLSGAVKRWRGPQDGGSKVQFSDVGFGLPFVHEPDCGLALVVKSHLDELSNPSAKTWAITAWFNHALDIRADLQKAWKLWDAVSLCVKHPLCPSALLMKTDPCWRPGCRCQHRHPPDQEDVPQRGPVVAAEAHASRGSQRNHVVWLALCSEHSKVGPVSTSL